MSEKMAILSARKPVEVFVKEIKEISHFLEEGQHSKDG